VLHASAVLILPLILPMSDSDTVNFGAQGFVPRTPGEAPNSQAFVAGYYFRALNIPLVRGRGFSDSDTTESSVVAIVSDALDRKYWCPAWIPAGVE
jgi:hypothetical protein